MIYDMHCHVDLMQSMTDFSKAAQDESINLLAMTTTPKAYEIEVNMLGGFSNINIALGLHPQLVFGRFRELSIIEKYITQSKFIGEIGLDYSNQYYNSKEQQLIVFKQIIEWCQNYKSKVISIHSVRSDKDVLDILEKYDCPKDNSCILHWYSGTIKQLERAIEFGCYFSINEYMIKSKNGLAIIQKIPIKQLLIESDAPFISNIKTIEQLKKSLLFCTKKLSEIKGIEISDTISRTSRYLLENS